jgi:hypothetical protein
LHCNGALQGCIILVHLASVFQFGIRQMPELASAHATIAAQSSVEPKKSGEPGFGIKSALTMHQDNFLTTYPATGDSDGKDRRRRHENGQGKRSQVC